MVPASDGVLLDRDTRSGEVPPVARSTSALPAAATRGCCERVAGKPLALEYGPEGAEVAQERGLAGACAPTPGTLPVKSDATSTWSSAFDVLEHIEDDYRAAGRDRPGAASRRHRCWSRCPCDMKLWSEHDDAVGHVRRYTRDDPESTRSWSRPASRSSRCASWNVLLRPIAAWRRQASRPAATWTTCRPVVNAGLTTIIAAERYLPLGRLPGVSLIARASLTPLAWPGRTLAWCRARRCRWLS